MAPFVRAYDSSLVRAEFDKQYVADGTDRQKADARRQTFQRAVKDAQAKDLVFIREVYGRQAFRTRIASGLLARADEATE
jgi:hypothetical protein